MLDAQIIIEQVRAGIAPKSWLVYRAKRSAVFFMPTLYLLSAAIGEGKSVFDLISDFMTPGKNTSWYIIPNLGSVDILP
jgi:hypothetical protein